MKKYSPSVSPHFLFGFVLGAFLIGICRRPIIETSPLSHELSSVSELNALMQEAVDREDYTEAARLRDIIKSRKV